MPRSVIDSAQCHLDNRNPTPDDDVGAGYDYGSEWLNQTTQELFKCVSPANGVAVWQYEATLKDIDRVADNNADPSVFDPVTMNNYALFQLASAAANTANDSNFTFYNPGPLDPYVEITERTNKVFATFMYRGKAAWTPSMLSFVASRSNSNGLSYLRIYDFTNNQEIVEISFTQQAITLHNAMIDPDLLPMNTAVFELQARRSASNAGTAQIRAVGMYP